MADVIRQVVVQLMKIDLPDNVVTVLDELREDEDVREIWLIGSRVSNNVTPESDWDLLVMADREPSRCNARSEDIDVLWCGPSGDILLEGKPPYFMFHFSDLHWNEFRDGQASYRGRKLLDVPEGIIRDAHEPIQRFTDAFAVQIWSRDA